MDDAKKIAEEFMDRHSEWDSLVAKSETKWLSEYKRLLGKDKMFWGTPFSTYTTFKVFEYAFKDMIDECFEFAKKDSPSEVPTRQEISYGLFGEVVEQGELMTNMDSGAQA